MFIGRNLSSPLQMQIEKIIKTNSESISLTSKVDKDRPRQQNKQQYKQSAEEEKLPDAENKEEQNKLDLIA